MSELEPKGKLAITALIPLFIEASAAIEAGFGSALATFQAEVAGAIALSAQLTLTPPGAEASLEVIAGLQAQVEAALALGLTPPSVSLDLAAAAQIIADLQLAIGQLSLAVSIAAQLSALTASVDVYSYDGPGLDLQGAMLRSQELRATAGNAKAVLIVGDVDVAGVSVAMGAAFSVA